MSSSSNSNSSNNNDDVDDNVSVVDDEKKTNNNNNNKARIAVIGAAWWGQGWHIPHLIRNPNSELVAIVEKFEQPTAAAFLNLKLLSITQLKERYKNVPIYDTCEDLIANTALMSTIDGVIICTAHKCHYDMGIQFVNAGKNVLMEKPMTVNVNEARKLADAVTITNANAAKVRQSQKQKQQQQVFMVNNTANFRDKCFDSRRLVETNELGKIHHILCVMYSPLMFLFDDPANTSWVKPCGSMVQSDGSGNGFGWGQLSHLLAWIIYVGNLNVENVTAISHRSEKSGADLTDAALIKCSNGISVSVSGSCSWPGNEHGEEKTGKLFDIKMFGSKGVLMYSGDDMNVKSGQLELRRHDGSESYISDGFLMTNTSPEGNGPESLQNFINACRGLPFQNGADQHVGLQVVRVLDAMYRSAASGKTEEAL